MNRNKEFLRSIFQLENIIKAKRELLERLEHEAVYKAQDYGERIQSSGSVVDKMAENACKIADLKYDIGINIDRLINMRLEAIRAIDEMEDENEKQILYMRYLEYMKWNKINEVLGRSADWVFKCHGRALKNIKINFK